MGGRDKYDFDNLADYLRQQNLTIGDGEKNAPVENFFLMREESRTREEVSFLGAVAGYMRTAIILNEASEREAPMARIKWFPHQENLYKMIRRLYETGYTKQDITALGARIDAAFSYYLESQGIVIDKENMRPSMLAVIEAATRKPPLDFGNTDGRRHGRNNDYDLEDIRWIGDSDWRRREQERDDLEDIRWI